MGVIFAVHSKPEPPAGGSRGRLANASVLYSEGGRVPDGNEEVQSAGTGNLQGQDDVSARFPPFSLAHPIFARPGRRRRRGPVPANRDDLTIPSARVLEVLPSLSTRSSLLSCLVCNPVLREPRSRIAIRVASKAARCNVHSSQLVPRPIARTAHTVGLRWAVKISIIPVLLRFVIASFRVARPWTISVCLTWVVSIPRRQRGRRPVTWGGDPERRP